MSDSKFQGYCLPWRDLPGGIPTDLELFVVGDVHGQAELLAHALDAIRRTPKQAAKRYLIFLGDLIDRGPASIEAVKIALQGRTCANADEIHILPGNHDLRLIDVLPNEENLKLWPRNGGKTVLAEIGLTGVEESWIEISKQLSDAFNQAYLDLMETGPTHLRFGDLLFVHAGIHPHIGFDEFLALGRKTITTEKHWATIRYPFLNWEGGWDRDDPDQVRRELRPTVVVHGHTPALRGDLVAANDLNACDRSDGFRSAALDIGAAYRPQLAGAHFRASEAGSEVQIHGIVDGQALLVEQRCSLQTVQTGRSYDHGHAAVRPVEPEIRCNFQIRRHVNSHYADKPDVDPGSKIHQGHEKRNPEVNFWCVPAVRYIFANDLDCYSSVAHSVQIAQKRLEAAIYTHRLLPSSLLASSFM